jgi:hypothetical protein
VIHSEEGAISFDLKDCKEMRNPDAVKHLLLVASHYSLKGRFSQQFHDERAIQSGGQRQ